MKRILLAATVTKTELETKLRYPVAVSPKLDGIRVVIHPELGPVTRKLKPVPNVHMREILAKLPKGYDGEVITLAGNVDNEGITTWKEKPFNSIQSDVMSRSGTPRFRYYVFDCCTLNMPFTERMATIHTWTIQGHIDMEVVYLEQEIVHNAEVLALVLEEHASQGYEGSIIRDPNGRYKQGRSTLKEGIMVKYKEWEDAEGTIIGFKELRKNANELTRDELGYAKRSSHKDGKIPMGTLGAVILSTPWGELDVGSGFDSTQRSIIWNTRDAHLGRVVTFKFQPFGMKDKPRFPIWKGFRPELED